MRAQKRSGQHFHTKIMLAMLMLIFSSCYTARVSTHAQAGAEVSKQTINFFFWGLLESPKRVNTPICDSLNANGMAEVTVKNNFGYSLITVVTLGIWSPVRLEWICGKPCQKVGTL